ncbi:MAG: lytic transglycosylase domain-containing protein [Candidatus Dormibacteraeota bacterium]|nr:lytic transglycosylase domain-containing protein [Candidatus Dormibacteraeota bacterium]
MALALLLAACGGAGSMTPTPRPTATPATLAPSRTPSLPPLAQAVAAFRSDEARNPMTLAAQITTVEQELRSPSAPVADEAQLAALDEVAYVQLATTPSWQPTVLAELPAAVAPIARANLAAATDIDMLNRPRDTLPDWAIQAPLPASVLLGYYRQAQQTYGVPWQYLAAINLVETGFGRIHGLSSAGAEGPMQFEPATWDEYGNGGDVNNPADAIPAAARCLKAHGAPGDMRGAIYGYNPTDLYVDAITRYAAQMQASMAAFDAYYAWPVLVSLQQGYGLLAEGFSN